MTDETADLWGVADEIDDIIESWRPDEQPEPPSGIDDEWVRKRLLALRFIQSDVDRHVDEVQRLVDRRDRIVGALTARADAITAQLTAHHRAIIADQERHDREPSTTIRLPYGDLRSKAGGGCTITIAKGHEADVAAWLEKHGYADAVVETPPQPRSIRPNRTKMRGLVTYAADGTPVGIVNKNGEACPHLQLEALPRSFWIDID